MLSIIQRTDDAQVGSKNNGKWIYFNEVRGQAMKAAA